jgi:hypothetical protein
LKAVVGVYDSTKAPPDMLADLGKHMAIAQLGPDTAPSASLAAIVHMVDEQDDRSFRELRQLRIDYPKTPVVVLASALSTNLGVELIKMGITDCLCVPAPPDALWRKIQRAMLHSGGPALDSPLLALLWDAPAYPAHEEKRRCFRSETVADYPAYLTVTTPTMLPRMLAKNVSILTEGCPGGLALVGSNVHVHALAKSPTFRFVLDVPEFPKPIPGQAMLKRVLSTPSVSDPAAVIGVEYRIDDPAHEAPVRRFWSESQRRVAAIARSAAGRIE